MSMKTYMASSCRVRVKAILTSFNRRDKTLACLRSLAVAAQSARVDVHAILVDDASTDGTARAVRDDFDWVEVIEGAGDMYWNRGMYVGFERALADVPDYFLWLNDDTELCPDALARLINQSEAIAAQSGRPVIMVGSTVDSRSGQVSYGGSVARSRLYRFTYRRVWDDVKPVPCETMNGNCVLIPLAIARRIGNLDPVYEHAMGDTDYALRAREAGFTIFVAAGVMGSCSSNPRAGSFTDESLPWRKRWQLILDRKGLPVHSWLHFTRRHGGLMWPLYFAWPYAKLAFSNLGRTRYANKNA
jgi:GT2 family glycosyltransferase